MARILIPSVSEYVRSQRKKRSPDLPSLLRSNNRMDPRTIIDVMKAAEAVVESPVTVGAIEGGKKLFESAAKARAGLMDTEGMSVDVPAELLPIDNEAPSPEDRMPMAKRGVPSRSDYADLVTAAAELLRAQGAVPTSIISKTGMRKDLGKESPLAPGEVKADYKTVETADLGLALRDQDAAVLSSLPADAQGILRAMPENMRRRSTESIINAAAAGVPMEKIASELVSAAKEMGITATQVSAGPMTAPVLPRNTVAPAPAAEPARNGEPAAPAAARTEFESLVPGVEQINVEDIMTRSTPASGPLPDISELSDMASLSAFARGADTREKQQLALRAAAQLRRRPRNAFEALGIMERDPADQLQLARQVASLFPGDDQVALIKARTGLEREATSRIKAIVDGFRTKAQIRKFLADTKKAYKDAELTAKKAKRFDEKVDAEIKKLKKELRYMDVRGAALKKQADAAMLRAEKYKVYPPVGRAPRLPPRTKAAIEGWDKHLADLRKRLQKKVADRDKVATIPDPGPEPKVVAVGKDGKPLAVDVNKPYFDWQRRKQEADTARSLTTSLDGAISDLERKITYAEGERKKLAKGFDAKSKVTTEQAVGILRGGN